jgi:hypothetical protein
MIKLNVMYNKDLAIGDSLLIFHYPAGDTDTLPWPLKAEYRSDVQLRGQLRTALWDAIETGELPSDTDSVLLPDGTEFKL